MYRNWRIKLIITIFLTFAVFALGVRLDFSIGGPINLCFNYKVYAAHTNEIRNIDGVDYEYVKFTASEAWTVPHWVTLVDVFMVGGGGGAERGGGGGGYTKTYKRQTTGWKDGPAIPVTPGENIDIIVGTGGQGADYKSEAQQGGYSQFKNSSYRAIGGSPPGSYFAGDGGSGGGGAAAEHNGGSGGSDGRNGTGGKDNGGTGQGHTTREFGDSTGDLYAGGGAASASNHYRFGTPGAGGGGSASRYFGSNGQENSGGGGGGHYVLTEDGEGHGGNGGSGIVIVRYIANQKPTVSVALPAQNGVYSETEIIAPTIYVSDQENDTLTCKYYIDSDTIPRDTKTVTNTSSQKTVTFNNLNINTLSEGNHTLKFEVNDGITQSSQLTVNIIVDKTPPTLGTVTVTSTTSSITIGGSASDSIAGLDTNPYRYTVGASASSWGTGTSYTKSSLVPNTQYLVKFEARDKKGHIANNTGNIYTKAQTPSITVSNASSYTLDVITSDNNTSNTQYQISTGSKYVTPEGTLTTSPIWITLTNKKITVSGLSPSTTYAFQAKAKNGDGIETELSSPASGTTLVAPPGSPANITATATNTSITVTWDAIAGAVSYDIEVDGSIANNGTNTTYTHTNLTPGTPHTYRIRANNAGGNGNWSAPITKSTSPESPYLPLNINAAATDTKIILTWDAVAGATGYDIEVDSSVVNNGSSTNYVHAGLLPGTTHSYRVRSINAGGKSDWSSEVLVTTQVDTPQIPSNIETTEGKTQIVISWDAVAGATGYDLEADGFIVDNGPRTTYTHSSLIPGSEHTYRVRSKKSGRESDWSPSITVSTLEDVFGKPTGFKAKAEDISVSLNWSPVADATGYDVEVDGVVMDNELETYCMLVGFTPNTGHSFRVRARSGDQTSDWTEAIYLSTYALPTPQGFSATATEDSITAVWEAVYGADSYEIDFDGGIIGGLTAREYTFEALEPGSQYMLKIRAVNDDGTSAWSEPLVVSTLGSSNAPPAGMFAMVKTTSVRVMWAESEGAESYDLEVDGTELEGLTGTSYLHEGLSPGTEHTYRLRIIKEGAGEWSSPLTVSTLSLAPAVPTNIAISTTMSSVLISWDAVENATGYDIEVDGQVINAGQGTSYLHAGLSPDTPHSYRVRSKSIAETSPWSEIKTAATGSSTQTFILENTVGDAFSLVLTASNVPAAGQLTFTVTYNPDELELLDLCATTPRIDQTTGNIVGTDLQVIQLESGTIVMTKTFSSSQGQGWSGLVNTMKFKAKTTGQATVTYSLN